MNRQKNIFGTFFTSGKKTLSKIHQDNTITVAQKRAIKMFINVSIKTAMLVWYGACFY